MRCPAPVISATGLEVTLSLVTTFGDMPAGARIYYTLDGTDPGDFGGEPVSGTLYTDPFTVPTGGGAVTVTARVYGPPGYTQWFTVSNAATIDALVSVRAEVIR